MYQYDPSHLGHPMMPPLGMPGMGMPPMGMPPYMGMPGMPPGAFAPPMGMGAMGAVGGPAQLSADIENDTEDNLIRLMEYYENEGKKYQGIAEKAADKADECRKKARQEPVSPPQGPQMGMGMGMQQMPPMGYPYAGYPPYPPAGMDPSMMYSGWGHQAMGKGMGKQQQQGALPQKQNSNQSVKDKKKPVAAEPSGEPAPEVPEELKTTVMLKNIPNDYKRGDVKEMLDEANFSAKYDFLYVPRDFQRKAGLGYAFVNMVDPEAAREIRKHFEGYSSWKMASQKVCETAWGHPHQGLDAHIQRYRDSPLMHPDVQQDFKPMLFKDGVEIEWPDPSRKVRKPRMKSGARNEEGEGGEEAPPAES